MSAPPHQDRPEAAAPVEAQALVSGRVQGVCFRETTRQAAEAIGCRGWVRNLADGRVEVHVQGSREQVEALLAWCREGPELARVTGVELKELAPGPPLGGFKVLTTAAGPQRE